MHPSTQTESIFDLGQRLLEILHRTDRNSLLSIGLASLSSVGAVKTYIKSKDTINRFLARNGLTEEYTAMRDFLFETLSHIDGHPERIEQKEDTHLLKFDLDGMPVYFIKTPNDTDACNGAYIKDRNAFRKSFRRMFWERQGNKAVILSTRKQSWRTHIVPQPWKGKVGAVIGKHNPETLLATVSPFLDRGIGRMLIIAGQPGTGKTSLARQMIADYGHILRVTPESMEHIAASTFIEIVELVAPDVLLLDDFDRAGSWWTARFLEQMESLNEQARANGRLVIATVNHLSSLDTALKRPGRFDHLIVLDLPTQAERRDILSYYINEFNLKEMSQQKLNSLARRTKNMPGAYLRLLCERLSVHGIAAIDRELKDVRQQFELCHDFEESKFIQDLIAGRLAKKQIENEKNKAPMDKPAPV